MKRSDKFVSDFAIRCRKVRLYVANNPGLTSYEITKAAGVNSEWPLRKMAAMGIVRFSQIEEEDGRRPQRWYVVPQ